MTSMREHDFEPLPGLPEELPDGEVVLWQGAPDWRTYAYRGLHIRALTPYFLMLLIWNGAVLVGDGLGIGDIALSLASLAGAAIFAIGLMSLFAWITARTTVYTITNRRVVLRFGIALPIIINLPFRMIDSVDLKPLSDGTGDIAMKINARERLAYLVLWPHAKPFALNRAEPMLRAVPDAFNAAQILAQALVASGAMAGSAPARAAIPQTNTATAAA
jgi:hypothetical protein